MREQAVIVSVTGQIPVDLDTIEPELSAVAATVPAGEYDGNEIGPEGLAMYLYAEDADALYDVVVPILKRRLEGSTFAVRRRYGEPGAEEVTTKFA
jgi:hypothetical protein